MSGLILFPNLGAMEVDASFDNFILFLWGRDEAIAAEEFRKLIHTSVRRRIVSSSLGAAVCSTPPTAT